jgi:hypothetical protein
MRLLDRLFGHLAYPFDVLVPSALWLAACLALLVLAWRRRPVRLALAAVLLNMSGWAFGFGMRMLGDGAMPAWAQWLEAPFLLVRAALGEILWQTVGVMAAPAPAMLFRGYSSWNGHGSVLLAALLNESALIVLVLGAIAAAWRAARKSAARTAGEARLR